MFEFEPRVFFKNRLSKHLKELNRYLRYMFNGHIAFALFFFITAFAYFYQGWLKTLPEQFPTAIVIGILFGLVASYSPVRTLLREPDLVFLLAVEEKMHAYFRRALIYSYVVQLYIVLVVAAALSPLYFTTYDMREGSSYLGIVIVLLIIKLWNLLMNWWMLRIKDSIYRNVELIIRLAVNIAIFTLLVYGNIVVSSILTVLFIGLFLIAYNYSHKQAGMNWELLLEKDQQRMQGFYQLANMFTDVPHLKGKVRRRGYLTRIFSIKLFGKDQSYRYLYRLSFLRSGDYFGMFIRLVVIGAILIYIMPHFSLKLAFALLFLYITSIQLMTLYRHHRTVMWLDIYPLEIEKRIEAVVELLFKLSMIQLLIFSLVLVVQGEWISLVLVIGLGTIFNTLFIQIYIKNKYKKESLTHMAE